ncbi:MAG TPA: lasso peptide biosynthesis B2 protein [Terriglobia bacterium]|nr:lasso peptide biosynthesis B2 protein [Terriglobia bacterium]
MSKAQKFLQLSTSEKCMLIQALLLLPFCAVVLRLRGVRCLVPASAESFPTAWNPEQWTALQRARAAARMVGLAARWGPYRANCLKRSLVAYWLLRRQGIACALRIGVRKESNQIEAHAWLEYLGEPLNEGADIHLRFSPFDRIVPQQLTWT